MRRRGAETEGERETLTGSTLSALKADAGLDLTNSEIMT